MNKKNKKNTVRNMIVVVLTTILMAGMTIVPAMADDTVVSAAAETESVDTDSTAADTDSEAVSADTSAETENAATESVTESQTESVTDEPDFDADEDILEQGITLPPRMFAVYRVYNPNTGEHVLTGSQQEVKNLAAKGWNDEGVAWYFLRTGRQPIVSIARFYNPNTGEHFYVNWDSPEVEGLLESGWKDEGMIGNAPMVSEFSQRISETTTITVFSSPVYRLCNPNCTGAGAHHYTTDAAERDHLVSLGWRYEGVAWNGVQGMVA